MATMNRSPKRDAMLRLLRGTDCHPSAEWLYRRLREEYPGVSLGTVYRNLNQLAELGLVRSVGTVHNQERYDARMDAHDHFVCNRCGVILDLPGHWPAEEYVNAVGEQCGFTAESHEFIIRGLCEDCKKSNIGGITS